MEGGKLINWIEDSSAGKRQWRYPGRPDLHHDGLGRTVMTRAGRRTRPRSWSRTPSSSTPASNPGSVTCLYFESGTLDYRAPTFASPYIQHQYDALGREVRMTQPDGSYAETRYEHYDRTHRDEEQDSPHYGAAIRYVHDGLLNDDGQGRLRQVYEITPEPWLTQYRYDLLDNLTGYIDAQNNRKFVEYDGLGRQRFMRRPPTGVTCAGNTTTQATSFGP